MKEMTKQKDIKYKTFLEDIVKLHKEFEEDNKEVYETENYKIAKGKYMLEELRRKYLR